MMFSMRSLLFAGLLFFLSTASAETVLITGSNKGIGLEFATQYAAKGWQVIATHRRDKPPESLAQLKQKYGENFRIESVDITDLDSVKALAKRLDGAPIDVLINNAGYAGNMQSAEQTFGTLEYDKFETIMRTNGLGALMLTEHLKENIIASKHKKIVAMSSTLASFIDGPAKWGAYWYRMSKAALHMSMFTMARDLKDQGVTVTVISPGIVMSEKNLGRGIPAAIMVDREISIEKMIGLIDQLDQTKSGKFIQYDGKELTF